MGHYHQYRDGRDMTPIAERKPKPPLGTPVEDAFWSMVSKQEECWEWTGTKLRLGYGQFKHGGLRMLAYRYSWELANGKIPEGAMIDHICHNPSCVNPDHLRPVTHKQNMENRDGAHKNSKSGVRGVYWSKDKSKWRAVIKHNRQAIHLGYFKSLEEAESAVIAARARYFTHSD
jgi:hypothetical protein